MAQYSGKIFVKLKKAELYEKLKKINFNSYGLGGFIELFNNKDSELKYDDLCINEIELENLVKEIISVTKDNCIIYGLITNINVDPYTYIVSYLGGKTPKMTYYGEETKEELSTMIFNNDLNSIADVIDYLKTNGIKYTDSQKEYIKQFNINIFDETPADKKLIKKIKKFIDDELFGENVIFDRTKKTITIVSSVSVDKNDENSEITTKIQNGDLLKILREPNNIYNTNSLSVYNKDEEIIGYISNGICNVLSPYIDTSSFEILSAKIYNINKKENSKIFLDVEIVIGINNFVKSNLSTKEELLVPEGITDLNQYFIDNSDKLKKIKVLKLPSSVTKIDLAELLNQNVKLNKIEFYSQNRNFFVQNDVVYSNDMKKIIFFPPTIIDNEYNILDGVQELCENSFSWSKVKCLTFPESLKSINEFCFYNSSIKDLYFKNDVEYIDSAAFLSTSKKDIVIHYKEDSYIGKYVSKARKERHPYINIKLEDPNINKELKQIMKMFDIEKLDDGYCINRYIGKESEVVVPDEIEGIPVKYIGVEAFYDFSYLDGKDGFIRKIVLPKYLERLEARTINVKKLHELYLPKGLKYIDINFCSPDEKADGQKYQESLNNEENPDNIYWESQFSNNTFYYVDKGSYAESFLKSLKFRKDSGIYQLHVIYKDEKISKWDSSLNGINFYLDNNRLVGCIERYEKYDGTDLYIPERVNDTKVVEFEFDSEYVPDTVTSLHFSKNIESIRFSCFEWAPNVKTIEVDIENNFFSTDGTTLFNKDKTKIIKVFNYEKEEYIIPDGVKEIGDCAFAQNKNIKRIMTNHEIKSVGVNAFFGCSNLEATDGLEIIKKI